MSYGWRDVEGTYVELCDECGFDSRQVTDDLGDLDATFVALAGLCDHADAARRPEAETFSADEYVEHCVEVTNGLLAYLTRITDIPDRSPATDLAQARVAAAAVVGGLTDTSRQAVLSGEYPIDVTAEWIVLHLLHDLQHHVLDVRRGYASLAMADLPEVHTVNR